MLEILLSLIILAVIATAITPIRKARRELKRIRAIQAKEKELFAMKNLRHDFLETNGAGRDSPEHQRLLEEEIRIRLAIGELDPHHGFLGSIPALLQECTDKKGFVEWARAQMLGESFHFNP